MTFVKFNKGLVQITRYCYHLFNVVTLCLSQSDHINFTLYKKVLFYSYSQPKCDAAIPELK